MYENIIDRLDNLQRKQWGWTARCPAHEDRRSSLSVRIGLGGDLLLKCHAGCLFQDIVSALGVKVQDCWSPREELPRMRREIATYDYRDEQGTLLYQTVRFEPKDFKQRSPNGQGGWNWGLGEARRVLYRLPELTAAPGRLVIVVEGEKDADRLIQAGFLATTSPMGAGKWKPEYTAALAGRIVVVIPDADKPGEEHALAVAASLKGTAQKVVIVRLPEGKDVSVWLELGHTAEELKLLIKQAMEPTGVRDLLAAVRKLARPEQWLLVRQILADLELG